MVSLFHRCLYSIWVCGSLISLFQGSGKSTVVCSSVVSVVYSTGAHGLLRFVILGYVGHGVCRPRSAACLSVKQHVKKSRRRVRGTELASVGRALSPSFSADSSPCPPRVPSAVSAVHCSGSHASSWFSAVCPRPGCAEHCDSKKGGGRGPEGRQQQGEGQSHAHDARAQRAPNGGSFTELRSLDPREWCVSVRPCVFCVYVCQGGGGGVLELNVI
ncbi:hypothetical protein NDU88_003432 [Pleurodeles waltl]|uniref:Secreted protein n=1 Tax=Pleurodeles waltl TaxID=8319 RepID=A0AAV7SFL1_PLEWA|nr:hypothetical protein NDU88_003432 [Pleurodeles waltl]